VDPDSEAYGVEVRILLYGRRSGKFRVLFTVQADAVRVLAVRHAAQRGIGEAEGEGDEPAR